MNRILMTACLAISLALAGATIAPRDAAAANFIFKQASPASRPMQLDITGALGWYGLGTAVWYSIPIMPEGFAPKLNDGFYVEFGGAILYYYYYFSNFVALSPMAGVRYDVHMTDDWTVFVTTKAGWRIAFERGWSTFEIDWTGGAFYRIADNMQLRLEAGYPYGAQAGISILF